MKKNLSLFFLVIVASLVFAYPVGILLGYISPSFRFGGFATFSTPADISLFSNGLPISFLFLQPLFLGLWGKNKKWVWVVTSIIPILIFSFFVSQRYFFWSVVFFLAGLLISLIINFFKNRKGNSVPV